MAMIREPYETAEAHSWPTVRQVSVFVDNRVGQLLRLTRLFEHGEIRIRALSVMDAVDCAVVRFLFNKTDQATQVLKESGFAISVSELLVVRLPAGKRGLLQVWAALLAAEVSVAYAYPLLSDSLGSAIAMSVDSVEIAADMLQKKNFNLLDETELENEL